MSQESVYGYAVFHMVYSAFYLLFMTPLYVVSLVVHNWATYTDMDLAYSYNLWSVCAADRWEIEATHQECQYYGRSSLSVELYGARAVYCMVPIVFVCFSTTMAWHVIRGRFKSAIAASLGYQLINLVLVLSALCLFKSHKDRYNEFNSVKSDLDVGYFLSYAFGGFHLVGILAPSVPLISSMIASCSVQVCNMRRLYKRAVAFCTRRYKLGRRRKRKESRKPG